MERSNCKQHPLLLLLLYSCFWPSIPAFPSIPEQKNIVIRSLEFQNKSKKPWADCSKHQHSAAYRKCCCEMFMKIIMFEHAHLMCLAEENSSTLGSYWIKWTLVSVSSLNYRLSFIIVSSTRSRICRILPSNYIWDIGKKHTCQLL